MFRRRAAARAALVLIATLLAACGGPPGTPTPSASGPPAATPSPSPTGTLAASVTPSVTEPASALPTGPDRLRLETVVQGLDQPIGVTQAGDGSGRLFVNEQAGSVRVVLPDGTLLAQPFVDLRDRVESGGERGLLGLAFHPDFASDRRLFVDYTRKGDGATVVSELRASADGTRADPASERILLTLAQPYANHNGGEIAFGPDGYLYIGLGDGGSGGDPHGNGQSLRTLLGKILRIDVDGAYAAGRTYAIPRDNPFAAGGQRPGQGLAEIWAYGLRNPWRFSFDRQSRDLYIGDVGQASWEEIDRQSGDSRGGENYGWNVMEGRHCYSGSCNRAGLVEPIAEYSHSEGCSMIGGYVYRGTRQPLLRGVYIFGDYCSGTVFTLQADLGTTTPKPVAASGKNLTSFGEAADGEIYVVATDGTLSRLVVAA